MLTLRPVTLAGLLAGALNASALVVGDPAGNTNNTSPDPTFPFANTGYIDNGALGSATYIGDNLVLTPLHNIGNNNDVVFNGTTYTWDSTINGGTGYYKVDGANSLDLVVIRINETPTLPDLSFYCEDIVPGLELTITGTGVEGLYNDNGTTNGPFALGDDYFTWAGTRSSPPATHWGTNEVELVGADSNGNSLFITDFDRIGTSGSTSDESSGARGDSGGGAYVLNGGNWELAGIIFAAEGGQDASVPADEWFRSAYGYESVYVDLTQYKVEIADIAAAINSPVPEPSGAMLALLSIAGLGLRRRRRAA